jgi:hypothetical protein
VSITKELIWASDLRPIAGIKALFREITEDNEPDSKI